MTDNKGAAVDISVAYYRSWTAGMLDSASSYLAENVICNAPAGELNGRDAVRAFMEPFAASLTGSTLLAAFGADDETLLMYSTGNDAVPSAPGAELHRVQDGQIVEIRIIFDRLPFALARGDVVKA